MMQEDIDYRAFVETLVPLEDWNVMYIDELEPLREEGFAELVVQLHVPEGQTLDEVKEATLSKFATIKPNTDTVLAASRCIHGAWATSSVSCVTAAT